MFSSLIRILKILDVKARHSFVYIGILTIAMITGNALIPFVFREIVNRFELAHGSHHSISLVVLFYGALWTINKLIMPLQFMFISKFLEQSVRSITQQLFVHFHSLSLRFHLERKTGAIMATVGRLQRSMEMMLYGLCISIVPALLAFVCTFFVFSYFYDFSYSLLFLCTTICSLGFSFFMLGKLERRQKAYNSAQDAVRQQFLDSLLNYETVKYFNNEQQEFSQFDSLLQQQEQAGKNKYIIECLFHFGQNLLFGLCLAYVTWKSANQVLNGAINLGDFILINSYLLRFIIPLESLGRAAQQVKKSLVSFQEINQILDYVPEIIDAPNAITLKSEPVSISFQKVCFGYQPEHHILSDLTFSVPQGKSIAIVGSTGAGKSTITKLLLRLYDVESGAIKVNNHDIRTVTQASLRSLIGVVAQEVSLFNDTLYYNITYGCPVTSMQEVERIVKLVELDKLVQKLSDGYQTVIGERGLQISGGERQRLSIARALLKKARVYIFDESTSSLDSTTEFVIQQNLATFFSDKTTITIAHRLSNVIHADEILVLERGTIVECGTHNELIALQGYYYQLWVNQHKKITHA